MKSVDTSVKNVLFPLINDDGWKFISVLSITSLIMLLVWLPLGIFSIVLSIWCFYSFRDPERVTPALSNIAVAPADGKILSITREKGPEILGLSNKTFTKICIYTSAFDVCVNRMPAKSKVLKVYHDCETKFSLSFDKNNIENERMLASFKTPSGRELAMQQTAVICAYRLKNHLKKSAEYLTGQRFGLMRFGGYTELYLPEKAAITVCVGQTMVGGETIVADFNLETTRIDGEMR